jgi:hypothetical protein
VTGRGGSLPDGLCGWFMARAGNRMPAPSEWAAHWVCRRLALDFRRSGVSRTEPGRTGRTGELGSSTPTPCGARCEKRNVTLGLSNVTLNVIFSWSSGCWPHTGPLTVKVDAPRRRHGWWPLGARLVARLTIRPPLLTLAPLAPLTAGAGVGNRHSPIDVGPSGAKSAPPGINRKGETLWQPSPPSPWPAT